MKALDEREKGLTERETEAAAIKAQLESLEVRAGNPLLQN